MAQNLGPLNIKDTYQSLLQISGSQIADGTGSLISSLDVSASYAATANSASYSLTASYAENVPTGTGFPYTGSAGVLGTLDVQVSGAADAYTLTSGSYSGSVVDNITDVYGQKVKHVITLTQAEFNSISASADPNTLYHITDAPSFATSASYATTADTASQAANADQAELIQISTASNNNFYRVMFASSNGFQSAYIDSSTFNLYYNPSTNALAGLSSVSATDFYGNATTATTASHALTANTANSATSASHALIADDLVSGANINISSITASNASFVSASITNLTTVTGSIVQIGDAFVLLNTSDVSRYAGILVEDSGSGTPNNYTASFFFDSQTNDWNYEYSGSDPTNYGVALFGPEYGTKGTPSYPTNNTLQKGMGGHHLVDSSITDNGSVVSMTAELDVTGGVSASAGFLGNLTGNAATATSASYASVATSASYALTASFALNGGGGAAGLVSGSGFGSLISANYSPVDAVADASGSIAIGNNAKVTGSTSAGTIAIGENANSQENSLYNVIIGYDAGPTEANRDHSVYIGKNAKGYQEGVAIGADSFTIYQAVAVGRGAYTNDNYGVALGAGARTNNQGGISLGSGSLQDGDFSIAIGYGAHATASGDIVVRNGYSDIWTYQSSSNTNHFIGSITLTDAGFSGSAIDNITDVYTSSDAVNHVVTVTKTEYAGLTPDANTLYVVTDDNGTGTYVSGALSGNVEALSITTNTASMDCSLGNFFTLTLADGANTHLVPSNIQAGQTVNLKITTGAAGTGTISFESSVKFPTGVSYTGSAASSVVDIVSFASWDSSNLYANAIENMV